MDSASSDLFRDRCVALAALALVLAAAFGAGCRPKRKALTEDEPLPEMASVAMTRAPIAPPPAPVAAPPLSAPIDPTLPETEAREVKIRSILTHREEEERAARLAASQQRETRRREEERAEREEQIRVEERRRRKRITRALADRLDSDAKAKKWVLRDDLEVVLEFDGDNSIGTATFSVHVEESDAKVSANSPTGKPRLWKGKAKFQPKRDDPANYDFDLVESDIAFEAPDKP